MMYIKNFKLPAIVGFFKEPSKVWNADKVLSKKTEAPELKQIPENDELENQFPFVILASLLILLIIMPDND